MWLYLGIFTAMLSAYYKQQLATAIKTVWQKPSLPFHWAKEFCTYQLGRRITEMHHAHYIVNYPHGFTWYKILIPRKRGPCEIMDIHDQDGNNVTDTILQFMGPGHNFHGIPTTPKMLGFESLTFSFLIDEKKFEQEQIISV